MSKKITVRVCDSDSKDYKSYHHIYQVYFHGDIEDKAGYDITQISNNFKDSSEDGIYDVDAIIGKKRYPCKMFFWKIEIEGISDPYFKTKGLIVSVDDKESLNDAQTKYNEKRKFL